MIPFIVNRRAIAPGLSLRQTSSFRLSRRGLGRHACPPSVLAAESLDRPRKQQPQKSARAPFSSSSRWRVPDLEVPRPIDADSQLLSSLQGQPEAISQRSRASPIQSLRKSFRSAQLWTPWIAPEEHLRPDGFMKESEEVVGSLLCAVRAHDSAATISAIRQLAAVSNDQDVRPALETIPRTTITSIFRLLDPFVAGHKIDYTHNLIVHERLQEISAIGLAIDEDGVRHVYKQLLLVLESFAELLISMHGSLDPTVYQVLLRCAGATSDVTAVRRIWRLMQTPEDPSGLELRDAPSWDAFLRSRYLTEELFAQNDISRTMHRPTNVRSLFLDRLTRRKLQRYRIEQAFRSRYRYGASPSEPTKDIGFTTSGRLPLQRITEAMRKRGIAPDERLSVALMRAKGRTGESRYMFAFLKSHYGFAASMADDHRDPELRFKLDGQKPVLRNSSMAILESTVTTLGMLGYSVLARRFLDFVILEHRMKVPRKVWSGLLKYTFTGYVARREFRLFNSAPGIRNQVVRSRDVIAVWDAMMAHGHSPIPSSEERNVYVQALIMSGRFDEALSQIRSGMADYQKAMDKVQKDLLAMLHPSPPPSARLEFVRSKSAQHTLWDHIATWCRIYLWSYTRIVRGVASVTAQEIPDLVAEFREFADGKFQYRTATGIVRLNDDAARLRHNWLREEFQSRTVDALTVDYDSPMLNEDGSQRIDERTGEPMYNSRKIVLSTRINRWGRKRRRPMWERRGLGICLVPLGGGFPGLKSEEVARCIEW